MLKGSVLVVDDEAIVRESIRDWLKYSGFEVEIAENGEEALSKMEKQGFNVLVLDIRLPGESGMNILVRARAIQPEIKSIILTAYPSEDTIAEAKKLGALDYLIKPLVPDELERIIRGTLIPPNREGL
jgi:DNA-binding NtrC family response regulator